jgi:Zn-finger nucleic acid-binding protein
MMEFRNQCPRCAGQLREWSELGAEEREVVKRLPASAEFSLEERKASRRWCTRCWYEESSGTTTLA